MNKNIPVIMALVIVAVLTISLTQSVLASRGARNVGGGTFADSGGNGGIDQSGGTATSGPATGTSGSSSNTGDWGSGVGQTGGTSNAIGCGHIGGSGSSANNC